jgi:chemotaxis response regulator CheB
MPKAAAALNAAVDILPLDRIAARINDVAVARVRTRRPAR